MKNICQLYSCIEDKLITLYVCVYMPCWIMFLDVCSGFSSSCCCLWKGYVGSIIIRGCCLRQFLQFLLRLVSWHDLVHSFTVDEYIFAWTSPIPVLQRKITIKFWTRIPFVSSKKVNWSVDVLLEFASQRSTFFEKVLRWCLEFGNIPYDFSKF